jgi:hypothetical protein
MNGEKCFYQKEIGKQREALPAGGWGRRTTNRSNMKQAIYLFPISTACGRENEWRKMFLSERNWKTERGLASRGGGRRTTNRSNMKHVFASILASPGAIYLFIYIVVFVSFERDMVFAFEKDKVL